VRAAASSRALYIDSPRGFDSTSAICCSRNGSRHSINKARPGGTTSKDSESRQCQVLACSFWLADGLMATGRREEAQQLFERLLGLRNDVGLLSEEYDPQTKRLAGNFPQALSRVALVNTAHNLTRSEKPVRQRSGHDVTRTRSD
jgi:hypothetical protein